MQMEDSSTILARVRAAARLHRRRALARAAPTLPSLPDLVTSWFALLDSWTLHRCMRVCVLWRDLAREPTLHTIISLPSQHGLMDRRMRALLTDEALRRIIALSNGGLLELRLHDMPNVTEYGLAGLLESMSLRSVSLTRCVRMTHMVPSMLPDSVRKLQLEGCPKIRARHMPILNGQFLDTRPADASLDIFACTECCEVEPVRDLARCSAPACDMAQSGETFCRQCRGHLECSGCGEARCEECRPPNAYRKCRCGRRYCEDCEPESAVTCSDCGKACCSGCVVAATCAPQDGDGCGASVQRCRRCQMSAPACTACGALQHEPGNDFEPWARVKERLAAYGLSGAPSNPVVIL
tara:strand:- start:82 stop:1140 length:1059 start_codon:yes stop_codon:yes gene_type:complete